MFTRLINTPSHHWWPTSAWPRFAFTSFSVFPSKYCKLFWPKASKLDLEFRNELNWQARWFSSSFSPFLKDIFSIFPSFNFVEMSRASQFTLGSPFPQGRIAIIKSPQSGERPFSSCGRRLMDWGGVVLAFLISNAKFVVRRGLGFAPSIAFSIFFGPKWFTATWGENLEKLTCVSPSLFLRHHRPFPTLGILTVGLENTHAKCESDTKYSLGESTWEHFPFFFSFPAHDFSACVCWHFPDAFVFPAKVREIGGMENLWHWVTCDFIDEDDDDWGDDGDDGYTWNTKEFVDWDANYQRQLFKT